MKKTKLEGDGAFQEKSKRIKKVNLGGLSYQEKTHGLQSKYA
jgi:ATP-dependent RNA helicase RhlE